MWRIKTLLSNKKDEIAELLESDWEPFAVIVRQGSYDKVYFKKKDEEAQDGYLWEKEIREQAEIWYSVIGAKIEAFLQAKLDRELEEHDKDLIMIQANIFAKKLEEIIEQKMNVKLEITGTEMLSDFLRTNQGSQQWDETFIESRRSRVTENSEAVDDLDIPKGDTYKIVDEVPEVAHSAEPTTNQETAIEKIKEQHGNITRMPIDPDGNVVVLAGSLRFLVSPSGTVQSEDTGAKINSTEEMVRD